MIDIRCMLWFHPCMPRSEAISDPPDTLYIEASGPFDNPIRTCRKHLNFTLNQLSQATGVHLQAIHLLENGCYTPILPRIEDFFVNQEIISLEDLRASYTTYQYHQRATFGRHHNFEHLSSVGDWNGDTAPFEEFRSQCVKVTRTALAKGLCVQPAALYRLATNEVKELPLLVQTALSEAGLPLDLVYELNERTAEYYYSVR